MRQGFETQVAMFPNMIHRRITFLIETYRSRASAGSSPGQVVEAT